jgi:hypothetical protein
MPRVSFIKTNYCTTSSSENSARGSQPDLRKEKKGMRKSILLVMTAILVLAMATIAMAADPFVGTWKLNVTKSKFPTGQAPTSEILKCVAQENGLMGSFDTVDAAGKASHSEFSAKYDGKDYPQPGDPNVDTTAFRKINPYTLTVVDKKAGKEVGRYRSTVSTDGKTTTITGTTKDATGKEVTSISVYDKQ